MDSNIGFLALALFWGGLKMSAKQRIKKKMNRLNRLVDQGRMSQADANEQVRQYARIVCRVLGG